ncbi:MAG: hypothetical protein KTR32_29675 [Granulosicoccus sp.]|nr:hypothetical protein [Granulosicoccus sp.]
MIACILPSSIQANIDGAASPIYRDHNFVKLPLSFSFGVDTVASQVDHEPHLEGGGFAASKSKPRHRSSRMGLSWSAGAKFKVSVDWVSRIITSKRDQFELDSYTISFRHELLSVNGPWSFSFGASISSNRASDLTKTSYTNYDGLLVTRVSLNEPYDRQYQANLIARRLTSKGIGTAVYSGLGRVKSDNKGFDGVIQDDEQCRFGFASRDAGSAVQLLEPCGSIQSYRRVYPSSAAFEDQYKINSSADVKSRTVYWQIGAQLSKLVGRHQYGIGYHYQRFFRDAVDQRLEQRGMDPLLDNHSISTWWHYRLNTNWQLETGAEYSRRPMLNRLFLLYTGFTSERFRQDAIVFSATLRYRFGRI